VLSNCFDCQDFYLYLDFVFNKLIELFTFYRHDSKCPNRNTSRENTITWNSVSFLCKVEDKQCLGIQKNHRKLWQIPISQQLTFVIFFLKVYLTVQISLPEFPCFLLSFHSKFKLSERIGENFFHSVYALPVYRLINFFF